MYVAVMAFSAGFEVGMIYAVKVCAARLILYLGLVLIIGELSALARIPSRQHTPRAILWHFQLCAHLHCLNVRCLNQLCVNASSWS